MARSTVTTYVIFYFLITITKCFGLKLGSVATAPYFESRLGTVQMTDASKPLGVMCGGIASCQNISTGVDERCLGHEDTSVLISCQSLPWKQASQYCQRYGGRLLDKDIPISSLRIQEVAKRLNNCRKFWLYQKAQPDAYTQAAYGNLSTVGVNSYNIISTKGPSNFTSPNSSATSNNTKTIIIYVCVTVGLLIILIVVTIVILKIRIIRRKQKTQEEEKNNAQERLPLNVHIPEEPLNVPIPEEPLNVPIPEVPLNVPIPEVPLNVPIPEENKNGQIDVNVRQENTSNQDLNAAVDLSNANSEPQNPQSTENIDEEGDICMRCNRNRIGCLFRPCDHSCCCWDCGSKVKDCLVCTSPVETRFIISVVPDENHAVS